MRTILYIYKYNQFISAIHCQWDEWVHGECTKSCGTGTRTNTRVKLVVEENGGTCSGKHTEVEECNTNSCPGRQLNYGFTITKYF